VWETDIRNGIFKTGVKMLEGKAGKGYATLAFTRVLEFYFNELRYQKCAIYVYDFNDASHHFHKKLGFVEEGRLRREYYSNGKYYDSVCYGLTIEEFNSRR
jgi:RimJ/RimL family protein N-acetyltransferase